MAITAPSIASGFASVASNPTTIESKYPLWKYVARKQAIGENLLEGGNVVWTCDFCDVKFRSTYY
jgi:hypothetical protein